MQRMAFLIHLKSEADTGEYLRRHDEIWPEMLDALRAAGIHNYSIYRHGTTLFAYLECEDPARMATSLAASPVNARWQEYMRDIISLPVDPATNFPRLLPEMFHMD